MQTLTSEAVETLEPDLVEQPELLGIVRSRDFPYTVEDLAYTNCPSSGCLYQSRRDQ